MSTGARRFGRVSIGLLRLGLAISACSPGASGAHGQQRREVDLRPRFEKGQEIRYEMRTDSTDESRMSKKAEDALDGIEFGGSSSRVQQRMELLMRVVEADAETGATVEMVVERVAVTVEQDGERASYDSGAAPKGGAPGAGGDRLTDAEARARSIRTAVDLMVGSKATFKVAPNGAITALNLPSSLDQTGVPAILASTGGEASAMASGAGVPFEQIVSSGHPTGLVKLREEWTSADDLRGLNLTMKTHHKLRAASGNRASVDMAGVLSTDSERTSILHADYEGSYDWDTGAGQLQKMDIRATIQIDTGLMVLTRKTTTGVRRTE